MRMTVAMKQYNLCVARCAQKGKRGVREGWWRLMCVARKGQGRERRVWKWCFAVLL